MPGMQPGYGQMPPQPPKKNTGRNVGIGCGGCLAVIVGVVIIAAVAGGGSSSNKHNSSSSKDSGPLTSSGNTAHPPKADITPVKCVIDDVLHMPSYQLKITNNTSKPSDYEIQVSFEDAQGNRVDSGYALENNLAPGQSATETAQGTVDVSGKGTIKCRVVKVDRNATLG